MTQTPAQAETRDAAAAMEVLVFAIGDEAYAVDILKVQEIRGYSNVTRIANVPPFVKGVTNLRGSIVPIIDARIKFGLDDARYDKQTVVIVLKGDAAHGFIALRDEPRGDAAAPPLQRSERASPVARSRAAGGALPGGLLPRRPCRLLQLIAEPNQLPLTLKGF